MSPSKCLFFSSSLILVFTLAPIIGSPLVTGAWYLRKARWSALRGLFQDAFGGFAGVSGLQCDPEPQRKKTIRLLGNHSVIKSSSSNRYLKWWF